MNRIVRKLLSAIVLSHLAMVTGCAHGTMSRQVSGPESNSDGSTTVGSQTTTDRNGTTKTVRERTTMSLDGSVRKDRETRTTVDDGTDNEVSDNRTSETMSSR